MSLRKNTFDQCCGSLNFLRAKDAQRAQEMREQLKKSGHVNRVLVTEVETLRRQVIDHNTVKRELSIICAKAKQCLASPSLIRNKPEDEILAFKPHSAIKSSRHALGELRSMSRTESVHSHMPKKSAYHFSVTLSRCLDNAELRRSCKKLALALLASHVERDIFLGRIQKLQKLLLHAARQFKAHRIDVAKRLQFSEWKRKTLQKRTSREVEELAASPAVAGSFSSPRSQPSYSHNSTSSFSPVSTSIHTSLDLISQIRDIDTKSRAFEAMELRCRVAELKAQTLEQRLASKSAAVEALRGMSPVKTEQTEQQSGSYGSPRYAQKFTFLAREGYLHTMARRQRLAPEFIVLGLRIYFLLQTQRLSMHRTI